MTATFNGFDIDEIDRALARCAPRGLPPAGSRLFITGGTGFIGRWLLALLARARARIGLDITATALTRDPAAFRARHPDFARQAWLTVIEGDVRDFHFPRGPFTHVIHAATDTSAAADRHRSEQFATIVDGTRRALALARESGARRFLFLSSGAVYGRQPADVDRLSETFGGAPDPLDPRAVYGEAKRAAEMLCAIAAESGEMEPVAARIFAAVGPGLPLDGHFAIGNFIRDALAGGDIRVSGDGTALRSYIHAPDMAAWLMTLLCHGRSGAAYNVGSDEAISIADLARRVRDALAPHARVVVEGRAEPNALRSRYIPSIDRARDELGLACWTPLDDAIRATAANARAGAVERRLSA